MFRKVVFPSLVFFLFKVIQLISDFTHGFGEDEPLAFYYEDRSALFLPCQDINVTSTKIAGFLRNSEL